MFKDIVNRLNSSKKRSYAPGSVLGVIKAKEVTESAVYRQVIDEIKVLSKMPAAHFQLYYQQVLSAFFEYVQCLPRYWSGPLFGLLHAGLSRAVVALRDYDQQYPKEAGYLHRYALFSAALLQDIGRVLVSQKIVAVDEAGELIAPWAPFTGSLVALGYTHYRLLPMNGAYQRIDHRVRPIFARQLLPEMGYDWLASDMAVFADWLSALNEDDQWTGGVLTTLLSSTKKADLLAEEERLMQAALAVKSHPGLLTQHGQAFYDWFTKWLESGEAMINSAGSEVHVFDNGVFLDERLLTRFLSEYKEPITLDVLEKELVQLMGMAQGDSIGHVHAQYVSDLVGQPITHRFSSLSRGKSELRAGLLLSDPGTLFTNVRIPAVSPLMRLLQSPPAQLPPLTQPKQRFISPLQPTQKK